MSLFHFLASKESITSSGLLNGTMDIHNHILPGVDDGVCNYDKAVQTLSWFYSNGVRRIYLTPHVMSDFSKNTAGYLSGQFDLLVSRLASDGITNIPEIKLAAEYMLEAAFRKYKEDKLLTYANRHILVETSYISPPLGFMSILENLFESGYTPVLAHPERYHYMDMNEYTHLKSLGIRFQLNYISMVGAYGAMVMKKAVQLLMEGFYDFTGSDIHHMSRQKDIYQVKKLTDKHIPLLCTLFHNNQQLW